MFYTRNANAIFRKIKNSCAHGESGMFQKRQLSSVRDTFSKRLNAVQRLFILKDQRRSLSLRILSERIFSFYNL